MLERRIDEQSETVATLTKQLETTRAQLAAAEASRPPATVPRVGAIPGSAAITRPKKVLPKDGPCPPHDPMCFDPP